MSLKSQLYKSIRGIPDCIAGGYIDLDSKTLLDMLTRGPESKKMLPKLVGITEDLFQGENVKLIESIFKEARGIKDDDHHFFKEMVVMNKDLMHIFLRCKKHTNHIVIFIMEGDANMGLSISKVRTELPFLEKEVA